MRIAGVHRRFCLIRSPYDERGTGTLLVVGLMLLLLSAGLICALWAAVSLGHHRAAAAADLAALSGAGALQPEDVQRGSSEGQGGGDGPCFRAARIATAHGAELVECEIEANTITVVAAVPLQLGALGAPRVQSTARAGPG